MIQFHQITKTYKDNDFILGELNFHIEKGEFVFLIGPSGSGKTSVIRLLIREEAPSKGKIFFDDDDITRFSRGNVYKLRRQIGVIFQDYKLIPDKNVYENVSFAMEVAGRTNKEIKETVPYLLDIVGLSQRVNAFPEQLSGGEKQRVAIARAVANNPRVLIADEPTGNLDPGSAWDIVQILSKINNWGTTVIMSTHGTDIVNTLHKRVIQMNGGKVVRDDSKGRYEMTGDPTNPLIENQVPATDDSEKAKSKKGPIKVVIKHSNSEQPVSAKKGLFGFLFGSSPKVVANNNEAVTQMEDIQAEAKEIEKNVDESEAKQILAGADTTPISALNLRPEIVADLTTAGYDDIEDIITAGPEELGKKLIIDPSEVVEVAKALTDYIARQEKQLGDEQALAQIQGHTDQTETPEPEPQAEPEPEAEIPVEEAPAKAEKPAKSKTKLSLTASKSRK